MKTIILASRNPHKIEELRHILPDMGITVKSALDYPGLQEVEENQPTLEGNALKKALYVFQETGMPSLADDTGLEVDALDGRPGVRSARFAGEEADPQKNTARLLQELKGYEGNTRLARFRTVLALVNEWGSFTFEGVCPGAILKQPRGEKGFGYDPVFQPEGYDKSFAELEAEEKNRISHRSRAIAEFVKWLQRNT